jgi:hypothetical protein
MKIVICTPHNGETKAPFTHALARLLIYTGKVGVPGPAGRIRPELDFIMIGGSNIANNRINLAEITVEAGVDFLLWLDSDMAFPHYTLERLIAANQAVVGCNYGRRDNPTGPTAYKKHDGKAEPVWTTPEAVDEGLVERVHGLGLGVCLMAVSVFQKIERPWFEWGPDGEDGYLFDKIADAGIPVMLDHRLSSEVKHIAYSEITNEHTVRDRADWLQSRAKIRKHG